MMMMWEWGNGADSSWVRTSAAGLLESGGERRFGVVLLCLRGLEWNKEKREKKTSRLQHVKAAHVSYMTSVRSLILRWWWQCGDLLLNKFLRFLSLLFVLPFFFFFLLRGGKRADYATLESWCYSRPLHRPIPRQKGDVWLQMPYLGKMLGRFEWLGRGRMASCDLGRDARAQWGTPRSQ